MAMQIPANFDGMFSYPRVSQLCTLRVVRMIHGTSVNEKLLLLQLRSFFGSIETGLRVKLECLLRLLIPFYIATISDKIL